MLNKLSFCVVACTLALACVVVAVLPHNRGPRLIMASQSITVRCHFPPGWSEHAEGPKHDSQGSGIWSPVLVDAGGRYITLYIGEHGDLYWQYLFGFRTYERFEDIVVSGKAARFWASKDGSFVLTISERPDAVEDPSTAIGFVAVAGNGDFSSKFVRDFAAQLEIDISDYK